MLGNSPTIGYQVDAFYKKVQMRNVVVKDRIDRIVRVVQDIMKEVEIHEPRFISTLSVNETTGRYDGLLVHSPSEYEIIMYLNQMGVFNFVDDGSIPGCAVLKLSDGRKRSMSLWVEFITASGYLSSKKIRGRFHTLVAAALEKPPFSHFCRLEQESSDVRLRIDGAFIVQITCTFRCNGIWPRSAAHWPNQSCPWPGLGVAQQIKSDGFDLCSKDVPLPVSKSQACAMEGDAFAMSMSLAESNLLVGQRRKCLAMLKCLRDSHLDGIHGSPINNYLIKSLLLSECEKHPHDFEWHDHCLGDRIIGILLQLVSCLQCRQCPHYFLPQMDLLRGKETRYLDLAAHQVWALLRQLMLDARALEKL